MRLDLMPYVDNEKMALVFRAARSGDPQWLADALKSAREEPRLDRVCDYVEQQLHAGAPLFGPPAVAAPIVPGQGDVAPPGGDEGSKGGAAGTDETAPTERGGRHR